jgi:hypothetical protein
MGVHGATEGPTAANLEGPGAAKAKWADAILAWALTAGTMAVLTATLGDFGMSWDEGFTVEREERVAEWLARVMGANPPPAFDPNSSNLESRVDFLKRVEKRTPSPWGRESLRFFWPFAREEPNGHPPFYALLGVAGWAASHHFLPPLESYRWGPAALFALTVGAMYGFVARHYGRLAGMTAALGLLAMPRVFVHAHLASYDAPTLCLWFLAVAAFLRAVEPGAGRARTVAFGIAWGCAAATKFTGWFVPVPLAAWALLYRDLRAARVLVLGGIIAALVLYALIPPWWPDPIVGVRVFLRSNLNREEYAPIPTLFFGRVYRFALPWYNTLAWTAITVPPLTLALAAAGIAKVLSDRLRDRTAALLLGCWVFLMALRALPNAPGHDGERLFLPAFAFLACLAGLGVAGLAGWLSRGARPGLARPLAAAAGIGVVGAGAWATWHHHPLQLSYYNALIGGLSGATRAGMEPTYYWDALTPDVRDWINSHTREGRTVIIPHRVPTFEYLHRWGLLRPSPLPNRDQLPRWVIVQNRPGQLRIYRSLALSAYLLEHYRPAHVKTSKDAPDVPLVAVYSVHDAVAAEREMSVDPTGGPETPGRPAPRSRDRPHRPTDPR